MVLGCSREWLPACSRGCLLHGKIFIQRGKKKKITINWALSRISIWRHFPGAAPCFHWSFKRDSRNENSFSLSLIHTHTHAHKPRVDIGSFPLCSMHQITNLFIFWLFLACQFHRLFVCSSELITSSITYLISSWIFMWETFILSPPAPPSPPSPLPHPLLLAVAMIGSGGVGGTTYRSSRNRHTELQHRKHGAWLWPFLCERLVFYWHILAPVTRRMGCGYLHKTVKSCLIHPQTFPLYL